MGRVRLWADRRRGSEFALIREIGSDFSVKSYQNKIAGLPVILFWFLPNGSNRSFAEQKRFGAANETKKCLHFFVSERKSGT